MEPISPRDIARPSRSGAVRLYRLSHLAKDVRMFSHCKVSLLHQTVTTL